MDREEYTAEMLNETGELGSLPTDYEGGEKEEYGGDSELYQESYHDYYGYSCDDSDWLYD